MRLKIFFVGIAALMLTAPLLAAATPEEEIAKALAGRTAGPSTDCIIQHEISSTQIVARTAILYEMRNGTIYLNRPETGANFLHRDYALVTDTHSNQLCNIDIVRLLDPVARFESGSVGLGRFVPYPRPPRAPR